MKIIPCLWCALCVLALGFNSHAATNDSSPRMTIELRDGSRVVGQSADDTFKFQSPLLGELKLAVKDIRSIECAATNSAKLTTAGGDVLTVWFADSELCVTTGFGKVELPVNSIRHLSVSAVRHPGLALEGLVALWSGEGNANDSVGGCNGQLVNDVGFTPGKVGQAFDLNNGGSGNSYVFIPVQPALNVSKGDGFTITAWISPATISRQAPIVEFSGNVGSSIYGVCFWISTFPSNGTGAGCVFANIIDSDVASHNLISACHNVTSAPGLVIPNVWQHIALTYDKAAGRASIYLNGNVVAEQNIGSFTPKTDSNLVFGGRISNDSGPNPSDTFSGKLDEVGLYNRALSAAEIMALCREQNNGGPLPPPAAAQTDQ